MFTKATFCSILARVKYSKSIQIKNSIVQNKSIVFCNDLKFLFVKIFVDGWGYSKLK